MTNDNNNFEEAPRRKVRIAMSNSDPVLLIQDYHSNDPKVLMAITLESFSINNSTVKWTMKTNTNIITEGSLGEKNIANIPGHRMGAVNTFLCMPIMTHRRGKELGHDFMFTIPNKLRLYHLSKIKEKFGTTPAHNFK